MVYISERFPGTWTYTSKLLLIFLNFFTPLSLIAIKSDQPFESSSFRHKIPVIRHPSRENSSFLLEIINIDTIILVKEEINGTLAKSLHGGTSFLSLELN
jgi:hypothetical protein